MNKIILLSNNRNSSGKDNTVDGKLDQILNISF